MKLMLNTKKILLAATLLLIITVASAMPGPTTGGPPSGSPPAGITTAGTPPCWSPPCVPIDGGIGLLLAAGAFIGGRKLYKGTR